MLSPPLLAAAVAADATLIRLMQLLMLLMLFRFAFDADYADILRFAFRYADIMLPYYAMMPLRRYTPPLFAAAACHDAALLVAD